MGRIVNQETIELIKRFEGCRLEAYQDPVGIWTIGYGHTAGVKEGMKITKEQAEEYLKNDLLKYSAYVDKYVTTFVPNDNQYGALTSFCYNCGAGNLKKLVSDRSAKAIAEKMISYNKAGGKVLAGLTRRRAAEKALFLKDAVFNKKESGGYQMKLIQNGSTGKLVVIWQIVLGINVDGIFDDETEKATKEWQKANDLAQDGIVGEKSWKAALEGIE